jgi:hypothetical protein
VALGGLAVLVQRKRESDRLLSMLDLIDQDLFIGDEE